MDQIWRKYYQQGVPHEINPKHSSLVDFLDSKCREYADKVAFSNFGSKMTYKEFAISAQHFAIFLQRHLALQSGDRFCIMLPNIMQYPVALYGVLKAGLVVVNLNPLYTPREMQHQLLDSGAKGILLLENFADKLEQILNRTDLQHVVLTRIGDMLPLVKRQVINTVIKHVKKMVPTYQIDPVYWFNKAIQMGKNSVLKTINYPADSIAFLQYTGGTTGKIKGAVLTHANLVANIEQATGWVLPELKQGEEVVITALPLYHIFSLTANLFTFISLGGTNVFITNPKDLDAFVQTLIKTRFTAITGVNTLFNALCNHQRFSKVNFKHLKLSLGGGMAIQSSVAKRWQEITDNIILEAYGLTETSPAACINPLNVTEFSGSVGLPIASTEISIRDENDQELKVDEIGELWIKGPQIMQEYWQQPGETKKVKTDDGWLKTGDLAKINSQGFVTIVDRKKELIIISGFNVYPSEIEDILVKLDGVAEVAVIGVANKEKGEQVKAFIVRSQDSLTEQQVVSYCRENLTGYKVPSIIEFRDELPKSPVGKILKIKLDPKTQ